MSKELAKLTILRESKSVFTQNGWTMDISMQK